MLVAFVAALAVSGAPAFAQAPKKAQGLGAVAALPVRGVFMALGDVNVRAAPKGTSRKVGFLQKGDRVDVVAVTRDKGWFAVLNGGVVQGFVVASAMVRVIDGALDRDITAKQTTDGVSCDYRIHFEGRTMIEGELFQTANYAVVFHCAQGRGVGDVRGGKASKKVDFFAQMFLGEAPGKENVTAPDTYQLTVDVRLIDGGGDDDIVSTSFLYDPEGERLVFDAAGDAKYQGTMQGETTPAASIRAAVAQAVRLSMGNWNSAFWDRIFTAGGRAK
ncbi:SH3 domain-containing protein [Varunaivibrio sulfuroxidans]|uniref:SH3 domain-containing protein n=1 Tax=Varunaivibrio sulfuroxidans TaxID=1773489 RepID=UPI00140515D4|nr:SH3 domain-containing protein [Varunaivibrio sulfuroxidans]WES30832.1 SH3 domain-containing protein [Varunaivibrio sulfuroxidans]